MSKKDAKRTLVLVWPPDRPKGEAPSPDAITAALDNWARAYFRLAVETGHEFSANNWLVANCGANDDGSTSYLVTDSVRASEMPGWSSAEWAQILSDAFNLLPLVARELLERRERDPEFNLFANEDDA